MKTFIASCACEEDLKVLSGMDVTGVVDCSAIGGVKGVEIDFEGKHGEKRSLLIDENGHISLSEAQYPVFCGTDICDYTGYTIKAVHGDATDGLEDFYIELVNDQGHSALLFINDAVFDGESMHIQDSERGVK